MANGLFNHFTHLPITCQVPKPVCLVLDKEASTIIMNIFYDCCCQWICLPTAASVWVGFVMPKECIGEKAKLDVAEVVAGGT